MNRPTRIRHSIVGLALLVNLMCYTDRVCISVAVPKLRDAFHANPAEMGLVLSIFSLSYALGQAPWGWLADRFGSRWIVAGAILGWSAFTALTGAASSFAALLAIRFTFGALEAALSPSVAAAFGRWIPVTERAGAFGAFLGGGRLGGALTPPLAALVLARYGWRAMFFLFGALGLVWAVAWTLWYRDDPRRHPCVNDAEREWIRSGAAVAARRDLRTPWRELLSSSRLWCLLGVAFGSTFLWQFYITWFFTYLIEVRKLTSTEASYFAGLPFLVGVGANWVGGFLTDALGRRWTPRRARARVGFWALLAGAALMSAGLWCPVPRPAALLMALAAAGVDLYLGAAWSAALDIGGSSGGAVAGLMNAASNGAGFASPALMGWVLHVSGNWNAVLLLGVAMTICAAFLWLGVNRPVLSHTAEPV